MKLRFPSNLLTLLMKFLKESQCKILGDKEEVVSLEKTELNLGVITFQIDQVVKTHINQVHILLLKMVENIKQLLQRIQPIHMSMKTLTLFLEQEMLYKMI